MGCCIRLKTERRAKKKEANVQKVARTIMPCCEPCFFAVPPRKARITKPISGIASTIWGAHNTICSEANMVSGSALQQVEAVDVEVFTVALERDHDGEAHRGFRG